MCTYSICVYICVCCIYVLSSLSLLSCSHADIHNIPQRKYRYGSGFVASPYESLNALSLSDGNGGCYANAECSSSDAKYTYSMTIINSSRTHLLLSFPIIHRNSTKISLYDTPMSASYVNQESGTATQSPVAYLKLYSYCNESTINATCLSHGACFDIIEAPITFLPYICKCASGYGGSLCETVLNDDQIKCESMCLNDMERCSTLYYAAATGTNDLGESPQVSVLNYALDYLHVNDSIKNSATYTYLIEDETAAFYQCWKIAQNTSVSSSNAVTALFQSTPPASQALFKFYQMYQIFLQVDVTYFTFITIFFIIFFGMMSCIQGPIRCFELI
jgi:hypothetical protein